MQIIRANERGFTELNWLKSYHSFSFGDYYNPENKGFNSLRVINDDLIEAKSGFDFHPHHDMEILTIVLKGAVTHIDSMGNSETIYADEFQLMSAGTGIMHSEHNLENEELRLLQIWIKPETKGLVPSYQKKSLKQLSKNTVGLYNIASPLSSKHKESSLKINQNIEINLYKGLEKGELIKLANNQGLDLYIHQISGELNIYRDGEHLDLKLSAGDGAYLNSLKNLSLESSPASEFLVFNFQPNGTSFSS